MKALLAAVLAGVAAACEPIVPQSNPSCLKALCGELRYQTAFTTEE